MHRWPRDGDVQRDGKELLETLAPLVDSGRMIEARRAHNNNNKNTHTQHHTRHLSDTDKS